jgi:hypothetical protein
MSCLEQWLTGQPPGKTHVSSSLASPISPAQSTFANSPLPLPLVTNLSNAIPRAYPLTLTPIPSSLRPHCLAKDRLRLWLPATARSRLDHHGSLVPVSEADLQRILTVIAHSHAPSTRESYGSGLLVFHVFCDARQIPEEQRCPASSVLLLTFIAACAGLYSGKTLENYFYAIRAWHLLHGSAWLANPQESSLALEGASRLAPPSSKRPKRDPFTIALILALRPVMDLTDPLQAATYACLTVSFFTIARTGEFTVPSLHAFDPLTHIKVSDIRHEKDRNGFNVIVFHIPRTKSSPTGEDLYCAAQSSDADPRSVLNNHLHVNTPPINGALFSWRHASGVRPLTRSAFLQCLRQGAERLSSTNSLKGHGIRIGGTLEYLLRGVPFETVKVMGRWSSNAFILYLRKHAIILAPYLQDTPILEPFMRYTMPPPR